MSMQIPENPDNPPSDKDEGESLFDNDTFFDAEGIKEEEAPEVHFDFIDHRWMLKVVAGANQGAEFAMLPDSSYVIGTDSNSCDIVLHDASISRQHARISINEDEVITIEDLQSKNGTYLDGQKIDEKKELKPNTLVTLGATTFIILDNRAERETIVSPLLPSIVRALQKEDERIHAPKPEEAAAAAVQESKTEPAIEKKKKSNSLFAIIFAALGIALVGIVTFTLLKPMEIVKPTIDYNQQLDQALINFPGVRSSYNSNTGKLLLVGHVLSPADRTEVLYRLQDLNFIKSIDDSIVIDELVWREMNQVLSKNPSWRGITMSSPTPGVFELNGYLKTRKEAERLAEYLAQNFAYSDLLETHVTVEEEMVSRVQAKLQELGLRGISVHMANGEIYFTGAVGSDRKEAYYNFILELKDYPGIKAVKDSVIELPPEEAVINLTSKYNVTGYSLKEDGEINVVIGGRILGENDSLDGMTIIEIRPGVIFLEKGKMKYRIDYNK